MKILGIDPGYAILGYGVVEKLGNKFKVCSYGAITTDAGMPMTERLEHLYNSLREIIDEEKPSLVIGTGGYVTAPAIMAALKKKIPCFYLWLKLQQHWEAMLFVTESLW